MNVCPKCASARTVKNGKHLGRQRYRCKDCAFQFTRGVPRGRPASEKAMAVLLYTLGLSFNAIARIHGVTASTVMRWVRPFAGKTYEKPEPGQTVVVAFDETWRQSHLEKPPVIPGMLLVVMPVGSLVGNVAVTPKERNIHEIVSKIAANG